MAPQGATQIVLARTEGPFTLEKGPVYVPMRASQARGGRGRSLAALLERVQPEEHVLLVLRGLHAAKPPEVVVQVYVGLAEGAAPAQDDPHYAGTLNFFNVVRPPGAESAPSSDQFDSYDITDVVNGLRMMKGLKDPLLVTLRPVGTPAAGSAPSIDRVELVLQ